MEEDPAHPPQDPSSSPGLPASPSDASEFLYGWGWGLGVAVWVKSEREDLSGSSHVWQASFLYLIIYVYLGWLGGGDRNCRGVKPPQRHPLAIATDLVIACLGAPS